MNFASDNTGPVHPNVMEALNASNMGYALPYGADDATAQAVQDIRDVFEAPEAAVYLVSLGTAANSLILATLSQPWETVFCHTVAHIHEDECNAPEFYSGGTKLTLVPGDDAKMTAQSLRTSILAEETRGVHGPQRGPVSITQATERGTIYSLAEIQDISATCKDFGLPLHMDGARFANALQTLGCSAADMTWKSGVDAVTFGGTKNGLMAVEAVVFFDPKHAGSSSCGANAARISFQSTAFWRRKCKPIWPEIFGSIWPKNLMTPAQDWRKGLSKHRALCSILSRKPISSSHNGRARPINGCMLQVPNITSWQVITPPGRPMNFCPPVW
jgi:hypothetical protein